MCYSDIPSSDNRKDGKLSSIEDRNHNRTILQYDKNTLQRIDYAGGQYLEFSYENNHISCIRDILGRETRYEEYEENLLTKVTMANGGIIQYEYTPEGYLYRITDQNNKTYVTNYYDRKGRVVHQELSNGEEFIMFYDDAAKANTFVTTGVKQMEQRRHIVS